MFRSVRSILILAYGAEARNVFKELVLRVENELPELKGLHYGIIFTDPPVPDASDEGESDESFFTSPDRGFPISMLDGQDLTTRVQQEAASALKYLSKPQTEPGLNEWEVSPLQNGPVIVSLVDNSIGGCPDWFHILQEIRREWPGGMNAGLFNSFSLLLGPYLTEGFNGTKTSAAYQNTVTALFPLVRGGRNPEVAGEWMPPVVAVDGRIENNSVVESGSDCRRNLVDLIYGLVGVNLTDNSAFSDTNRENCRTAGVLRIGLQVDRLLAEHRFKWVEEYSSKLLGKASEVNTARVQDEATKWLSQSHLSKFDEILAKDLLDKHLLKLPESLKEPLSRSDDIEELFPLLKGFVQDHIQLIPGKVESQREELLKNFEKKLTGLDIEKESKDSSVSGWLNSGRFHGEIVQILKMIRGEKGGGLAGHGEKVEDLRSKKWIKVFDLEKYVPKIRSERLLRYQKLKDGLDELLQKGKDLSRFPEGETPSSIKHRIRELSKVAATSSAAAGAEKVALKNLKKKHKKLTEKEEDLESKKQQTKGTSQEELKRESLELLEGIKQLRREIRELKKKWGFVNGEEGVKGWDGWVRLKRLPSGTKFLVVNYEDERKAHDELNECRRAIDEKKEDLDEGVRRDSADGDAPHRAALQEDIREFEEKIVPLKSNWGSARKNLEDWQGELCVPREHKARMKWVQDSLENQLYVSATCAIDDEDGIKKEKAVLRGLKKDLRLHTRNCLWKGGLILSVLALALYLVLGNVFPGSRAEITSGKVGRVTILAGKDRFTFKVDGHSYDVTIPSDSWRMEDLAVWLNGPTGAGRTVFEESGGRLAIVSAVVGSDSSVQVMGGPGATALGLSGSASGSGVFSTKEFRWALGLLLLVALVLFIKWYLVASGLMKAIHALTKKIRGLEAKLQEWCTETVWLFQEAANNRVRLEVLVGAIKSIDRSARIVADIQERFFSFGEEILDSLETAKKRAGIEEDYSKTRAFYSVITRSQLDEVLLTKQIKSDDKRDFRRFEAAWSRSRMWRDFHSELILDKWEEAIGAAADNSYEVVRKFNLEQCLLDHADILPKGEVDQRWISDNDSPMAGLIGRDGGDIPRRFVCCDTGQADGKALIERLGQISDHKYNEIRTGDKSEAALLVMRPNVQGRRIGFIQGGIEGLLGEPWQEGREVLSRVGKDLDIFFNIENFDVLEQRSTGHPQWEELVKILPCLICSDSWFDPGPKSKEFKYGGFDLGCSITEILCRLAGVGLTDDEIKQLEALKEKDCAAGVDDGFVVAHKAVDELFDQDFKRVAKDIWECWQEAKEKALDSLDSGNQFPEAPESPEPDSEPKAPEAPEADSEPPDTEDSEPDIESGSEPDQEPDSEADNDTGDDPDPPDGDSE